MSDLNAISTCLVYIGVVLSSMVGQLHCLLLICYADEDVWVGRGDEVAKFGCFVFYALEIDVGDFEWCVGMSLRWCCYYG